MKKHWWFLGLWLFSVGLPLFFSPFYTALTATQLLIFLPSKILGDIFLAVYFYLNYSRWTPKWLADKKTFAFAAKITVVLILLILTDILFTVYQIKPTIYGMNNHFSQKYFQWLYPPKIAGIVLYFIVFTAYSTVLAINEHRDKKDKEIAALETQKLLYELNILKLQISPHFLFNALNNIRALIRKNDPNSEEYILKLSSILRFMLYQKINDKILLQDEIDLIQNFVAINTMGNADVANNIRFSFSTDNEKATVYPLLLYPFIENMFKHGKAPFDIKIDVKEGVLNLYTSNKMAQTVLGKGIGLNNVLKRLDYLYLGKYNLSYQNENGSYTVKLTTTL